MEKHGKPADQFLAQLGLTLSLAADPEQLHTQ
jgi:hypothetical protein